MPHHTSCYVAAITYFCASNIIYPMKKLLLLLALCPVVCGLNAQQYSLSLQAGGNSAFISKFGNEYHYAQRPLNPYEFIDTDGNFTNGFTMGKTSPTSSINFFADLQLERKLSNNWGISASLGINRIAYSYEVPSFVITDDPTLRSALDKIGDVKLTYLTSRLANVSKKWNRFTLTAGPELSYIIHKNYVTTVSWEAVKDDKSYLAMAGDGKGDANKLLLGATLGLHYDLSHRFYLRLGAQKIFSSLYKKDEAYEDLYKSSRPLQAELGLGFRIIH